MKGLKGALVFAQSGGPTSVINASAAGVFIEGLDQELITEVYGAAHGIRGILNEELFDIIQQVSGDDPRQMQGPFSKDTLDSWRKIIEGEWSAQGEIGTAIHAISEYYFNKTDGTYNYEKIDLDVNTAYVNFPNEFKNYVNEETFRANIKTLCNIFSNDLQLLKSIDVNELIYSQ